MQSPISLDPLKVPSAVVGQVVVFAAFALIAWALLREAAKVIIKVLLFLGLALAAALWLGLLEQSSAAHLLEQIGDWMILGIKAATGWLVRAWNEVTASR
jgi:hypothetical protein